MIRSVIFLHTESENSRFTDEKRAPEANMLQNECPLLSVTHDCHDLSAICTETRRQLSVDTIDNQSCDCRNIYIP